MLVYFPKPYPDEDFRSIIYRYHIRSGKLLFEETNEELFHLRSKRNIYFHHNISELVRLLNQRKYTTYYFLNNHTIYPLINSFLPYQKKEDFKQSLFIKDSLKNKRIFQDYIAKEIKYCHKCLEEDYEKYGEVYSHRFHQIHFLNYCERHQTELISKCPECGELLSNHYGKVLLTSPFCKNGHSLISNDSFYNECPQQVKDIFQDIYFIISNSNKINRDFVVDILYSELGKCGYAEIYSEYIQLKKLKKDFSVFLTSYLQIFDIQYNKVIDTRFYEVFTKKSYSVPNILAYLFLIQFVSNSAEEFFSKTKGYSVDIPFKNKYQSCLNKICKYYNKSVIRTYPKKYYPIYVQGIFSCPYCGYTYGRKWIWNKDKKSGEVKKPFLINWGELWESEVTKFYYQGLSLKDIADKLGMGKYKEPIAKFLKGKLGEEVYEKRFNPKTNFTLYNIHSRLETNTPNYEQAIKEIEIGIKEVAATNYDHQLLLIRRQNIVNIMNKNPNLKRKGIEELARTDYSWLMKNDPEWFNENLPKPYS